MLHILELKIDKKNFDTKLIATLPQLQRYSGHDLQ